MSRTLQQRVRTGKDKSSEERFNVNKHPLQKKFMMTSPHNSSQTSGMRNYVQVNQITAPDAVPAFQSTVKIARGNLTHATQNVRKRSANRLEPTEDQKKKIGSN